MGVCHAFRTGNKTSRTEEPIGMLDESGIIRQVLQYT